MSRNLPWAWFKIPLTTSFLYDSSQEQNLVVDITFGPRWVQDYFCFGDSANGGGQQLMRGFRDTPGVYESAIAYMGVGSSPDFGFDMSPVGVEAGNFSGSFTLYPNPSTGTFHITADALTPIHDVAVTVRSITGQTIFQRKYQPTSTNFSEQISLPIGAVGWYIVEMVADGERIVRRILVE